MRQPTITTVKEYNDDQQRQYEEHLAKCKANGVKEVDPFNRYFHKFPYKQGYVLWGRYPVYKKRKKDLIYMIS